MQIQVIEGYITGYARIGGFPEGIEVPDNFMDSLEESKIGFYQYSNGQAVFDEAKYHAAQEAEVLQEIRARRAAECFPIVNRGQVWYNLMTEEQREELAAWYQAWLDAPETKTVPERPAFITE